MLRSSAQVMQQLQKFETQTEAHVTLFKAAPTIAAATVVLLDSSRHLLQYPEERPILIMFIASYRYLPSKNHWLV